MFGNQGPQVINKNIAFSSGASNASGQSHKSKLNNINQRMQGYSTGYYSNPKTMKQSGVKKMLRAGDKIPSSTSRLASRTNSGHTGGPGLTHEDFNAAPSEGQHGSSIGDALPVSSGHLKRQQDIQQIHQKGTGAATQSAVRNVRLGQGPGSQGGSSAGAITASRAHSQTNKKLGGVSRAGLMAGGKGRNEASALTADDRTELNQSNLSYATA